MAASRQPPFSPVELGRAWVAQVPQMTAADATLEGLEAVFPQEVGLFADSFPGETSYPFCSHMLTIAQHYRAQLGVTAPLWDTLTLHKYFEEQKFNFWGKMVIGGIMGILATLLGGDVLITELPLTSKQMQENFHRNVPAEHSAWAQVCAVTWGLEAHEAFLRDDFIIGVDIVCLKDTYPLLIRALQHLGGQQSTEAGMQGRRCE
ncbi:LOW QUALITY PROTEIN: EEF1A lysine methyltransferase 3-like [Macrochelys suwanniensis]